MTVEHVDAVVPGDALGLELAEELERLRPFGMGNPGVNLLVPARAGLRRAADGRRAATRASPSPPAGVRSRAVGFGVGARQQPSLRRRRARATTSSRGSRRTSGRARSSPAWCCARCTRCDGERRATPADARSAHAAHDDAEWWDAVWRELRSGPSADRPANCRTANRARSSTAAARARSACSAICCRPASRCWSCAPTSRARRALLERELDAGALRPRRPWVELLGALRRREPRRADAADLVLADHAALARDPAAARALHARVRARPAAVRRRARRAAASGRRRRRSCTSAGARPRSSSRARSSSTSTALRAASDRDLPRAGRAPGRAWDAALERALDGRGAPSARAAWRGAACGCWRSSVSRVRALKRYR